MSLKQLYWYLRVFYYHFKSTSVVNIDWDIIIAIPTTATKMSSSGRAPAQLPTSANRSNQGRDVRTMRSFANALRMKQPNQTVASSIYSLPDSEAIHRAPPASTLPPLQSPPPHSPPAPLRTILAGSKQDHPRPHANNDKAPMRVITRHGRVLQQDGTPREPGMKPGHHVAPERQSVRRSVSDARPSTVNSRSTQTRENQSLALKNLEGHRSTQHLQPHCMSSDDFERVLERRHEIRDRQQQRQAEYHENIGRNPVDDIAGQNAVAELGIVQEANGQPPGRTPSADPPPGLFRRLSNSMKGVFRRRSTIDKRRVSGPFDFHDYEPTSGNGSTVHPEIKAVPLAEAQRRLSTSSHRSSQPVRSVSHASVQRGHSLRHVEAQRLFDGVEVVRSKSKKAKPRRPAHPAVPERRQSSIVPRKIVVGDPDRDTLFGDIIDAANAVEDDFRDAPCQRVSSGRQSLKPPPPPPLKEQYSRPALVPERLALPSRQSAPPRPARSPAPAPVPASRVNDVPKRKPVKKHSNATEEISMPSNRKSRNHDKQPDEPPILPQPARVTSAHDWRMDAEYPTVDGLFDAIDEMVAASNIPQDRKQEANREAHRLMAKFERPAPRSSGVDNDDGEPEINIDTFDNGSHVSWVATGRPNARTVHSDHRRFEKERHDNSEEQDEAAEMMSRLRRVRAGDDLKERRRSQREV